MLSSLIAYSYSFWLVFMIENTIYLYCSHGDGKTLKMKTIIEKSWNVKN